MAVALVTAGMAVPGSATTAGQPAALVEPVLDWSVAVPGAIRDVAPTDDGGVVVVGARWRCNIAVCWDIGFVARYRANGSLAWRDSWRPAPIGQWTRVSGVDLAGRSVFVTGSVFCPDGAGGPGVMVVRRYTLAGKRQAQWSTRPLKQACNAEAKRLEVGTDVTVMGVGADRVVLAAGYRYMLGAPLNRDGFVRAFTEKLRLRWTSRFETARYRGTFDVVDALTSTGGRRPAIYAAGSVATSDSAYGDWDIMLQRLRGSGSVVWTRLVDDGAPGTTDEDGATGVAVGRGVVVSGWVDVVAGVGRGWLGQFSTTGKPGWELTWPSGSAAHDVASLPTDQLLVTGDADSDGPHTLLLRSYRPTGDPGWQLSVADPKTSGQAVASRAGVVYVGAERFRDARPVGGELFKYVPR